MNILGINKELINTLSNKNSLLDSKLVKVLILRETTGELIVEISLILQYSKQYSNIKLVFRGIVEYGFYFKESFGDIASYKFFVVNDEYIYLSLDPVDESDLPSIEDQDFILSREVVGYDLK